jgi:hypothetical protein
MKNLLLLILLIINSLILNGQEIANEISNTAPQSQSEIEAELEKLIGLSSAEIKKGINDSGVNTGKLMKEFLAETLVKALADAAILSAPAIAIYSKYKKKKSKELAEEIADTREEYVSQFDELQKTNYDILKLKMQQYLYVTTISKNDFDKKYNVKVNNDEIKTLNNYSNKLTSKNNENEKMANQNIQRIINDNSTATKKIKIVKKVGNSTNLSSFERIKMSESASLENETKQRVALKNKLQLRKLAKKREGIEVRNSKLKSYSNIKSN